MICRSISDNIEIIINDKSDEVIKERFKSLAKKYQIRLEKSMGGSDFIFDCVHLFYYRSHKINLNCGESYMDSPAWMKNKKAAINKKYKRK